MPSPALPQPVRTSPSSTPSLTMVQRAACRQLSMDDWAEISAAISGNRNPRFTHEDEASFDRLFSQLLNLAAQRA
jgi:hypothetical protein